MFCGDAFGACYPDLQMNGLFIHPITTPTEFDVQFAIQSINLIVSFHPKKCYLTHFGEVTEISQAAQQLVKDLEFCESVIMACVKNVDGNDAQFCEQLLRERFRARLGTLGENPAVWDNLRDEIQFNAQGLAHAAAIKRKGSKL